MNLKRSISTALITTIATFMFAPSVMALSDVSTEGDANQELVDQSKNNDSESSDVNRISQVITKYQLSSSEERMRAEYLKNKSERLILERKLEELTHKSTPEINSNPIIATQNQAPKLAPNQVPQEFGGMINAINNDLGKDPSSMDNMILGEVFGQQNNLLAKIYINGRSANYKIGDKINRYKVLDIQKDRVVLSGGKVLKM